jgi:acyl-CoA synthetase (AMP-forming)/AMP-acid ligase II
MGIIFENFKRNVVKFPNKLAIINNEQNKTLTYSQLLVQVENKINFFLESIVPQHTRVAFCLHEGVNIPIVVLALNYFGVPVIPLNPALQPEQIRHLFKSVDADIIITESKTTFLFDGFQDLVNVVNLDEPNEKQKNKKTNSFKRDSYDCTEEFLITLSSGSTGNPKPIIFSEKNKLDRFRQATQLYNVTHNDVILCASPFFHSLGQRLTFLPLLAGSTLVQLSRFTPQKWCDAIFINKVTFTIPVSSHLHGLVKPLLDSPKKFISLRCLVSSSAAIDHSVKKQLFDTLSCDFHEMYGASEVATVTDLNKDMAILKPKSVGIPCFGVDVLVVNEDLVVCNSMQVGQIIVKSTLASIGYYKLPKITQESFVNGYFLTGDLGYFDADGYLYFVDRKKDIIISGGMNIYPSDIENIINKHSQVEDCTVIGIKDPYLIEVPVAVVVSQGDSRLIEREIRRMLQQQLAPYQRPMKYFFKRSLPLTASAKVDKLSLRDELNNLGLDLTAKLRSLQK